jgi:hypothetical protein
MILDVIQEGSYWHSTLQGKQVPCLEWQLKNLLQAKGLLGHIDGGTIYDFDND